MPICPYCKQRFSKKKGKNKALKNKNFICKSCKKKKKIKRLQDRIWFINHILYSEIPKGVSSPLRCAFEKGLITQKEFFKDAEYFKKSLIICLNSLNKLNKIN